MCDVIQEIQVVLVAMSLCTWSMVNSTVELHPKPASGLRSISVWSLSSVNPLSASSPTMAKALNEMMAPVLIVLV